ncbi:MAG: hypothetical protein ABEK50_03980 [bacterium]
MADGNERTTIFGTSYFGVRDPEHVCRDLDRFAKSGLGGILHTFSERDQRYYGGTMADVVEASRDRNFTVFVNPWGVGRVFGGEALSEFTSRFPDSCQLLSNERRAPAACFNAPAFRDFMAGWIEDAVATGADYIFWDEPHWYTPEWRGDNSTEDAWTCRCDFCREEYRMAHGEPLPEELNDRVLEFRSAVLIDFLNEMTRRTTEAGAGNFLCVQPGSDLARSLNQEELPSISNLDGLAVTPFWELHGEPVDLFVKTWSDRITSAAAAADLKSQIWIQGFHGNQSGFSEQVNKATEAALSFEPDHVFLWGWDACRVMSSLSPDDPAEVWRAFLSGVT